MGLTKRLLWILLAVLVVVQACSEKPRPQEDCNFVQNSQVQRVSWKGATPIVIYTHSSVPTEYISIIQEAMLRWEDALGKPLFRYGGNYEGTQNPNDRYSVIYWETQQWDGKKEEQGRTLVSWEGNQIKDADVKINASAIPEGYEFFTVTPEPNRVDLESLLVHELGHVLGLKHSSTEGSVMAEKLGYEVLRRSPSPLDVQSLSCEY